MPLRELLIALVVVAAAQVSPSRAGDWLGGQYFGQISGCGHCGGSLYGLGYDFGCGGAAKGCTVCDDASAPSPLPMPHLHDEGAPAGLDAIRDPAVPEYVVPDLPVRRTSHAQTALPTSRRTHQDILPIAPSRSGGCVKTVTHVSQPERLNREPIRVVAPNAWSGRLYR